MEITFSLEDPKEQWRALACARLLCDIQHICLFAAYLADEDVSGEFDFANWQEQKYESMILADVYGKLDFYAVNLLRFNFNSDPKITVGLQSKSRTISALKGIFDLFTRVIFFDAQRRKQNAQANKQEAEAALAWEKAHGEFLKNMERELKLQERFPATDSRAEFESNLRSALDPFSDGRHPPLKRIDVSSPMTGKKGSRKQATKRRTKVNIKRRTKAKR